MPAAGNPGRLDRLPSRLASSMTGPYWAQYMWPLSSATLKIGSGAVTMVVTPLPSRLASMISAPESLAVDVPTFQRMWLLSTAMSPPPPHHLSRPYSAWSKYRRRAQTTQNHAES